ncbi:MAG TPA: hypothetical protein DET40_22945 [Lentisphaeria bacterium]|nr:MAG: hypothetical protein A2X45_15840 [Lentisphaerae bacterium GWF2_50_93]HCE46412.1 hypothetical protein [Lentisphaeria bacterium]
MTGCRFQKCRSSQLQLCLFESTEIILTTKHTNDTKKAIGKVLLRKNLPPFFQITVQIKQKMTDSSTKCTKVFPDVKLSVTDKISIFFPSPAKIATTSASNCK